MKRVSKYERMVGTEINGVLVSNYRRIEKVSKTSGKRYYRYEVELNNVLWVSTTSFNKGSYGKRLAKAIKKMSNEKYEVMVRPLVVKDFIGRITVDSAKEMEGAFEDAMTSKEIRNVYKKYSKIMHPDLNGNTIGNVNGMRYLNSLRDVHLHMAEMFDSLFDEE